MQLTKEQAAEYRQRVARIEAFRQLAEQEEAQGRQLIMQAKERRETAGLLEWELHHFFLTDLEKAMGLDPADAHYVEEALIVRTEAKPKPEEKPE